MLVTLSQELLPGRIRHGSGLAFFICRQLFLKRIPRCLVPWRRVLRVYYEIMYIWRKVHPTLQKVRVGAGCRERERERARWERWADYTTTILFVYVWPKKSCDRPNCLTAPFRVGREVSACEEGESFCPRMQRHWVAVLASGVSLGCRAHAPINFLYFSNSLGCFSHCQETSASTDLMLGKDGGVSGINPP